MKQESLEEQIMRMGLTAPRVTPGEVEANIVAEYYFTGMDGVLGSEDPRAYGKGVHGYLSRLTFCVLVLRNGYTVTGENACASAENFRAQMGRDLARKKAVEQIWPLMGYALRTRLSAAEEPATEEPATEEPATE